jgi:hypothetical protein
MNYEANTIKWKPGDIVIHDADSKDHKMLMVILSVDDSGRAKSRYLNIQEIAGLGQKIAIPMLKHYKQIYENDIKYLHDYARFDIAITENDREIAKRFSE